MSFSIESTKRHFPEDFSASAPQKRQRKTIQIPENEVKIETYQQRLPFKLEENGKMICDDAGIPSPFNVKIEAQTLTMTPQINSHFETITISLSDPELASKQFEEFKEKVLTQKNTFNEDFVAWLEQCTLLVLFKQLHRELRMAQTIYIYELEESLQQKAEEIKPIYAEFPDNDIYLKWAKEHPDEKASKELLFSERFQEWKLMDLVATEKVKELNKNIAISDRLLKTMKNMILEREGIRIDENHHEIKVKTLRCKEDERVIEKRRYVWNQLEAVPFDTRHLEELNIREGTIVPKSKVVESLKKRLNEAAQQVEEETELLKKTREADKEIPINLKAGHLTQGESYFKFQELCCSFLDYDKKNKEIDFNKLMHSVYGRKSLFSESTKELGLPTAAAHTMGHRRIMEDTSIAQTFKIKINGIAEKEIKIVGVFDGHSGLIGDGKDVSDFAKNNIILHLQKYLEKFNEEGLTDEGVYNALKLAGVSLNRQLYNHSKTFTKTKFEGGTTTTFTLIIDNTTLWTGNVGDSRTVLIRTGNEPEITRLSADSTSKEEEAHILHRGQVVFNRRGTKRSRGSLEPGRVWGDISTFGGPSARPENTKVEIQNIDGEHHYLIQACDGFWDVAATKTVGLFVNLLAREGKDEEFIAKALVALAFQAGSTDNITVRVTKID